MNGPLVSILTPSFNQGRYLRDCLRSVASQTYRPIEHVVYDGGSTDESLDVLSQSPEHVQWVSEPDNGQSDALNKAFAASRGEIIGWLNSDDAYVDRRVVETAVDAFARYPEVGVVFGHGLLVNPANRVLQYLWAPPFSRKMNDLQTFFVQPAALIRRSVLEEPFVRDELRFVMDYDLWLRLAERTTFLRLDLVVGLDRHQPERKTLTAGFPEEFDAYQRDRGLSPDSPVHRALRKAAKVGFRLRGVPHALRLPHGIDPALPLRFDDVRDQLRRQVLVPRHRMPLD
jgi:glycosyltransferase involved in cell wall biosynthesis